MRVGSWGGRVGPGRAELRGWDGEREIDDGGGGSERLVARVGRGAGGSWGTETEGERAHRGTWEGE